MKTLLQIVQAASAEMGLTIPTQVVGNTDAQVQQIYYLLNGLGDDIRREYMWEALIKSYRFTTQYLITTGNVTQGSPVVTNIPSTSTLSTYYMLSGVGINQDTYIQSVDGPNQVTLTQNASASGIGVTLNFGQTIYPLPSDFDRQIDRTHYDKSKRWEMLGPETPQQWEFLKSSYISTGPRLRYRFSNGNFEMWPNITTNEYLGYEYLSNGWVTSAAGVAQNQYLADTDTAIFPDRLLITGLKMKFFEVKGFDTTGFYRDYMTQMNIAKSNDGGSLTLNMAPKPSTVLIGFENIPDGTIYGQS